VIIVDDRLARVVLSGNRPDVLGDRPAATTWGFQYRLVRALHDDRVDGRLSAGASDLLRRTAASPPSELLAVLDPRPFTARAARLSIEHRLNLLTAELLAAAAHHGAEIALWHRNVGKRWPGLFEELGLTLTIV
jgi:hypothetical protein